MNTWARIYITLTLLLYFLAGILFSGESRASQNEAKTQAPRSTSTYKLHNQDKTQALTFRSCAIDKTAAATEADPSIDAKILQEESLKSQVEFAIDFCGAKDQSEIGSAIQKVLNQLTRHRRGWPRVTLSLKNYATDSRIEYGFDFSGFEDLILRVERPLASVDFSVQNTGFRGNLELHFLSENKNTPTMVCSNQCRASGLRQLRIEGHLHLLSFCEGPCIFSELERLTLKNDHGTGFIGGMHSPALRSFRLVSGYYTQIAPAFWRGNLSQLRDVLIPLHAFAPMIANLPSPPPYIQLNISGAYRHPEAGELRQLLPPLRVSIAGMEFFFSELVPPERKSEFIQYFTSQWTHLPVFAKFHHHNGNGWETLDWWNPKFSQEGRRDTAIAMGRPGQGEPVGVAVVDFGFCGLREWLASNHYVSLANSGDFTCYVESEFPDYVSIKGFSKYSNDSHGTDVVKTILRASNGLAEIAMVPMLLDPSTELHAQSPAIENMAVTIEKLRAVLASGKIRVVNMSLVFPWISWTWPGQTEFKRLFKDHPGVLFVHSAGNDGIDISLDGNWALPLSLQEIDQIDIPNLIGVSGLVNLFESALKDQTTPELQRLHPDSNYGRWVEFAAPYSAVDAADRITFQGTSNAAPIITGGLVRILNRFHSKFGFYPCADDLVRYLRAFGTPVYNAAVTALLHTRTLEVDLVIDALNQLEAAPFPVVEQCQ